MKSRRTAPLTIPKVLRRAILAPPPFSSVNIDTRATYKKTPTVADRSQVEKFPCEQSIKPTTRPMKAKMEDTQL